MKILYVEDELHRNLHTMLKLFNSILSENEFNQCKTILATINAEKKKNIKKILEANPIITVCYSFPEAFTIIKEKWQEYGLFIIDRNLSETEYTEDDIENYSEQTLNKYWTREGDYLLSLLKDYDTNWNDKFYFLTANTNAKLKCSDAFQEDVERKKFKKENILDKSEDNDLNYLKQIIDNFKKGNYRVKFKNIFSIFRNDFLSKDIENNFLLTLENMDSENEPEIRDNLARIRKILEGCLSEYVKSLSTEISDSHKLTYTDGEAKGQIKISAVINYLQKRYTNGKKEIFIKDNDIIKNITKNIISEKPIDLGNQSIERFLICKKKTDQSKFLYEITNWIYNQTSSHGSHSSEGLFYTPTSYTVKTMIYALCDILLWYKTVCEEKS